jgi:hypothetical protein
VIRVVVDQGVFVSVDWEPWRSAGHRRAGVRRRAHRRRREPAAPGRAGTSGAEAEVPQRRRRTRSSAVTATYSKPASTRRPSGRRDRSPTGSRRSSTAPSGPGRRRWGPPQGKPRLASGSGSGASRRPANATASKNNKTSSATGPTTATTHADAASNARFPLHSSLPANLARPSSPCPTRQLHRPAPARSAPDKKRRTSRSEHPETNARKCRDEHLCRSVRFASRVVA